MLRLLLCLMCALGIAATLLALRQRRLDLQYECNRVHDEMLGTQARLWRQQVQIAAAVAPAALQTVLANGALQAAPAGGTDERPGRSEWDELFATGLPPDAGEPDDSGWAVLASGQ